MRLAQFPGGRRAFSWLDQVQKDSLSKCTSTFKNFIDIGSVKKLKPTGVLLEEDLFDRWCMLSPAVQSERASRRGIEESRVRLRKSRHARKEEAWRNVML